jgi:YesN/AraC family two-component response regulator
MTLYIKNMVCSRCLLAVQGILQELSIRYTSMRLGEVVLAHEISAEQLKVFAEKIAAIGFQLIDDKKSQVIEKIKNEVVTLVHHSTHQLKTNLSDHLAAQLNYDYHYLSNLFSEVEGTTIEKYYIAQKIERVKEFLVYNEFSLSEIAFQMGYSSVAHLSSQFKKVTGLTPSHFKQIGAEKRKPLDQI